MSVGELPLVLITLGFVIYLLVVSRRFRFLAAAALVFIVGVIGFIAMQDHNASEKRRQDAAIASTLIPLRDLEFREMRISRPQNSSSWYLDGAVLNNSKHTLNELTVKVEMKDCNQSGKPCTTIGEQLQSFRILVPPSQLRAFSATYNFRGAPNVTPTWSWEVTRTAAVYP